MSGQLLLFGKILSDSSGKPLLFRRFFTLSFLMSDDEDDADDDNGGVWVPFSWVRMSRMENRRRLEGTGELYSIAVTY